MLQELKNTMSEKYRAIKSVMDEIEQFCVKHNIPYNISHFKGRYKNQDFYIYLIKNYGETDGNFYFTKDNFKKVVADKKTLKKINDNWEWLIELTKIN